MLKIERLRPILILADLNDSMLKKMASVSKMITVKPNQYLFREGDEADKLYSVLEGKVALEISKDTNSVHRISDIYPYRSFGISSLVDTKGKKFILDAKTLAESKIVVWKADDLEALFAKDFKLGFLFIKRVGKIFKNRLQARNSTVANEMN